MEGPRSLRRGAGGRRIGWAGGSADGVAAQAAHRLHLGRRRGVWEDEFDMGYLIGNGPVSSAADWFARIAWTAFLEMQDTGCRPDGLRMLDE